MSFGCYWGRLDRCIGVLTVVTNVDGMALLAELMLVCFIGQERDNVVVYMHVRHEPITRLLVHTCSLQPAITY